MAHSQSRRLITTKSVGRGRVVSVYYSPINLRHELDFKGETVEVFAGSRSVSRAAALAASAEMFTRMKTEDVSRKRK